MAVSEKRFGFLSGNGCGSPGPATRGLCGPVPAIIQIGVMEWWSNGALGPSLQYSTTPILHFLPIDLSEHDIDAADYGYYVGDQAAFAHFRERLKAHQ